MAVIDPRWRQVQDIYRKTRGSVEDMITGLDEALRTGVWREFEKPGAGLQHYDTLAAFVEDFILLQPHVVIEVLESKHVRATGAARLIVKAMRADAASQELAPYGTNQHTGGGGDTTSSPKGENDATYLLRRLQREHPELARQAIDGEISVNAAAVTAGLRRRYLRVPDDLDAAIAKLERHFGVKLIKDMP